MPVDVLDDQPGIAGEFCSQLPQDVRDRLFRQQLENAETKNQVIGADNFSSSIGASNGVGKQLRIRVIEAHAARAVQVLDDALRAYSVTTSVVQQSDRLKREPANYRSKTSFKSRIRNLIRLPHEIEEDLNGTRKRQSDKRRLELNVWHARHRPSIVSRR